MKEYLIAFEDKVAKMFKEGKIRGPVHLSGGNEDELERIFTRIYHRDWVFSTHRWHYHYLLKGGKPEDIVNHLTEHPDKTMTMFDKKLNFLSSAIVGGCIPIAVGTALAIKMRGDASNVYCFVGDAATDAGHFFEAVRFADSYDLPITFIIEDNGYSCDTLIGDRWGDEPECAVHSMRIEYYMYDRKWPHVGIGEHVCF